MNIEEIRKGAPKGATHYHVSMFNVVSYYCYIDSILYIMVNNWEPLPSRQDEIKPL